MHSLHPDELLLAHQRRMDNRPRDRPLRRRRPSLHLVLPQQLARPVDRVVVHALPIPNLPPGVAGMGQNRRDGGQHPRLATAMTVTVRSAPDGHGTRLSLRLRAIVAMLRPESRCPKIHCCDGGAPAFVDAVTLRVNRPGVLWRLWNQCGQSHRDGFSKVGRAKRTARLLD